ncbi:FitA-like ribbon-helix-helix domain-containing protein [Nocardia alni]|uniref:FitA-like ribbon-helix-helix domain-containing protein n=1 Tax=Nocardia alni TaxID=2815723 RepID=UPI001C22B749|nr:antitoxin [Nocardia alni]
MAVAITIRNVPEGIRDELAARAASQGRSLQEFLMQQLIEITTHPPLEDVVTRARARVRAARTELSREDILAARDEDRR